MEEFKVNDYISLKLENRKTIIYVNGEKFRQCAFLLLEIPVKRLESLKDIESIDEAAARLDSSLEPLHHEPMPISIPPEVEFWGHCSNLQVWSENNYGTRLLHSNIAFPLLKKLTEIGDPRAKRVFKEEIAKRIGSGFAPVIDYLTEEKYVDYLSREEVLHAILEAKEAESLLDIEHLIQKELEYYYYFTLYKRPEHPDGPHYGIKNRHMEILALIDCQLSKVPESVSYFRDLKELDLDNNNIRTLPTWIKKLKSLEELSLWGNKFEGIPDWVGDIKSLRYLHLAKNPLKSLPKSLKNLKSLEHLDLLGCQLNTIPDWIEELESLKYLRIESNPLISPPKFSMRPKLLLD